MSSRSVWVHPTNSLRMQKGEFYTLYPDLRHFQPKFFSMYRMNPRKIRQATDTGWSQDPEEMDQILKSTFT